MGMDEIKKTTFNILKQIAPEADEAQIELDENLREEVDLDSMDYLNFITKLGEQFKIEIPEADYQKIETLDELFTYIKTKIAV